MPHWSTESVSLYQQERLFHAWLTHPGLGLADMVGLPRVRVLFASPGSCLYPLHRKPCTRRLDFESDIHWQTDHRKVWSRQDVEGIHCVTSSGGVGLNHTLDAGLGLLPTRACFNCYYPPSGHILDLPKPDLTRETFGHYDKMCLSRIGKKLMDYFVDDTARLIQYDFSLYDEVNEMYVRVTVAFERLDLKRWWPISKVETYYFRGVFTRGNYHGFIDDLKTVLLPLLTCLLACCLAYCVLQLARNTRTSYGQHGLRLFLCAAAIGLCICRVYYHVGAAKVFDKMLDDAYRDAPPEMQSRLKTQEEYLRQHPSHLPLHTVFRQEGHARDAATLLVLVTIVQFCLYDNYFSQRVTLIIVAVRRACSYTLTFVCFFFMLSLVFAVIGHVMFGKCMLAFSGKMMALLEIFNFQIAGELESEELARCDPVWGPVFHVTFIIVLLLLMVNLTFEYVLGVISEVRRQKKWEMEAEERDRRLEASNWLVGRCPRRHTLTRQDLQLLKSLKDFLTDSH